MPDHDKRRSPPPIRLVPEESQRLRARRLVLLAAGVIALVLLVLLFPRVLAFFELAARELRYLWWLVLLLALGIWLTFFFGRKRD